VALGGPGSLWPAAERRRRQRGDAHLLRVYGWGSARLWIITEADRSVTTILRPEDYW